MIITFPFEDDPYYKPVYEAPKAAGGSGFGSPSQPRSYPFTSGAVRHMPALVRQYLDLAQASGSIFPIAENWAWHGGVHLSCTKPIRAVANGTIVAYRLDTDYYDGQMARLTQPVQPKKLSASFVLIRHECDMQDPATDANRYQNAHFYSLYANLMPKNLLEKQVLLPLFLTTGLRKLPVQALRGDLVEVTAVNADGHNMVKVKVTDINTFVVVEGWLERMYLEAKPVPELGRSIRLSYPIANLYANHPSEKNWIALDKTTTLEYPVRVGEVIGYAGSTDSPAATVSGSFHFEILTAGNALVKPMKPLAIANLASPDKVLQQYVDGSTGRPMGKVWLLNDADLFNTNFMDQGISIRNQLPFHKGDCFLAAIPCDNYGSDFAGASAPCFKLMAMDGREYFAYASQAATKTDTHPDLVKNAWVSLTTDTDWDYRGWLAFQGKELGFSKPEDSIVESTDTVMQLILEEAHKDMAHLTAMDLQSEGVNAILRSVAVQFHSEWDHTGMDDRYAKLKSRAHPQVPTLNDGQFAAFKADFKRQQFWKDANVKSDGVDGRMRPLTTPMSPNHWHWHPIGFLAQMRECLTTDPWMSEEDFEVSIRSYWVTALKLIETRLKQLEPWEPWSRTGSMPAPPEPAPAAVVKEYVTLGAVSGTVPNNLWSNFEYWFGVSPNSLATPETRTAGSLPSRPAGVHVYHSLQGMQRVFKHLSMQRIMKGNLGYPSGAYLDAEGPSPNKPNRPLSVAIQGFDMEYIHIGHQYGPGFPPFDKNAAVAQNRVHVQTHEVAHSTITANANDHKITLPSTVTPGQINVDGDIAYGPMRARVLAEVSPNLALANAENIAFFIESAKFGISL